MLDRMIARAVPRVAEQGRRRVRATERPVRRGHRAAGANPPPRIGPLDPMITGPKTDRPHPAVRWQDDARPG